MCGEFGEYYLSLAHLWTVLEYHLLHSLLMFKPHEMEFYIQDPTKVKDKWKDYQNNNNRAHSKDKNIHNTGLYLCRDKQEIDSFLKINYLYKIYNTIYTYITLYINIYYISYYRIIECKEHKS